MSANQYILNGKFSVLILFDLKATFNTPVYLLFFWNTLCTCLYGITIPWLLFDILSASSESSADWPSSTWVFHENLAYQYFSMFFLRDLIYSKLKYQKVKHLRHCQKGPVCVSCFIFILISHQAPLSPCAQWLWPSSTSVMLPVIPHITGIYTLYIFLPF